MRLTLQNSIERIASKATAEQLDVKAPLTYFKRQLKLLREASEVTRDTRSYPDTTRRVA
jgi:hypothetical protein